MACAPLSTTAQPGRAGIQTASLATSAEQFRPSSARGGRKDVFPGSAEAQAVDDAGVVELIGNDGIIRAK